MELHAISTGRQTMHVLTQIALEIHPYVTAIHIREKAWSASELYACVRGMLDQGVPVSKLIVNDRADVAWTLRMAGVQLTYRSLPVHAVKARFPGLRIGCSVHALEEARQAEAGGADYVLFGHVYATGSKPGLTPRGLPAVAELTGALQVPLIAIGGIQPAHVPDLAMAGAAGIAVMSGIFEASSPAKAAALYRQCALDIEEKEG